MANTKTTLTKEDVWGMYDASTNKVTGGMIIARGMPSRIADSKDPIFGGVLPYKSVIVKVDNASLTDEVAYWLDYVLGPNCITDQLVKDGVTYIKAEYQCW